MSIPVAQVRHLLCPLWSGRQARPRDPLHQNGAQNGCRSAAKGGAASQRLAASALIVGEAVGAQVYAHHDCEPLLVDAARHHRGARAHRADPAAHRRRALGVRRDLEQRRCPRVSRYLAACRRAHRRERSRGDGVRLADSLPGRVRPRGYVRRGSDGVGETRRVRAGQHPRR